MTRTVGVLLAAGRSSRFGADKRRAMLAGRPLIEHAAEAMRQAPFDQLIAVAIDHAPKGFLLVPPLGEGQSASLRAGVIAAGKADRMVIVLADMPLIDAALIGAVIAACPMNGASAAVDDGPPMPPACFSAAMFPALLRLDGDRGAGALLRDLPASCRVAAPGKLIDIDRPDDLSRL